MFVQIFIVYLSLILQIKTQQIIETQNIVIQDSNAIEINIDPNFYSQITYSHILLKVYVVNPPSQFDYEPVLLVQKQQNTVINREIRSILSQEESDSENYFDFNAFITRSDYHFVQIPYTQETYYFYFRDLMNSKSLQISYHLYGLEYKQCYKNCQECNLNNYECECTGQEFGKSCGLQYKLMQPNYQYTAFKPYQEWKSWGFNVKKKNQYEIQLLGIELDSAFHYFLYGNYETQEPNYVQGLIEIQSQTFTHSFSSQQIDEYIESINLSNDDHKIIISLYSATESSDELKEISIEDSQDWYIILYFCIAVVIFISVTLLCLYFCYKKKESSGIRRIQQIQQEQQQNSGNNTQRARQQVVHRVMITQISIDKYMPLLQYKEIITNIPELKDQTECIVCLQDFEQDEPCRMTVCFHIFHTKCLDSWVKKNGRCPFCRHGLTKRVFEDKETLKTELLSNPYIQKILDNNQIMNSSFQNQNQNQDQDNQIFKSSENKFSEDLDAPNSITKNDLTLPEQSLKRQSSQTQNMLRKMKEFDFLFDDKEKQNISSQSKFLKSQFSRSNINQRQSNNQARGNGSNIQQNNRQQFNLNSQISTDQLVFRQNNDLSTTQREQLNQFQGLQTMSSQINQVQDEIGNLSPRDRIQTNFQENVEEHASTINNHDIRSQNGLLNNNQRQSVNSISQFRSQSQQRFNLNPTHQFNTLDTNENDQIEEESKQNQLTQHLQNSPQLNHTFNLGSSNPNLNMRQSRHSQFQEINQNQNTLQVSQSSQQISTLNQHPLLNIQAQNRRQFDLSNNGSEVVLNPINQFNLNTQGSEIQEDQPQRQNNIINFNTQSSFYNNNENIQNNQNNNNSNNNELILPNSPQDIRFTNIRNNDLQQDQTDVVQDISNNQEQIQDMQQSQNQQQQQQEE